jgi:uncharacterized membrane protein
MSIYKVVFAFFSVGIPMALLDAVWLGVMAPLLYRPRIGHLMLASPHWTAAIIFYLMYVVGLVYFIVYPSLTADLSLKEVFIKGALLGAFAYATYDLTNQATLKQWSWTVTLVDIVWGAVLSGTVCAISIYFCKKYIA